MIGSRDKPELELERAFEWGVVMLWDAESTDELPTLERGAAFVVSRAGLAIVVRHAQDTDADLATLRPSDPIQPLKVAVRCWVNAVAPAQAAIRAEVDMPRGCLMVGDAEKWDEIHLAPGASIVEAVTEPRDSPEAVSIWFNLASE